MLFNSTVFIFFFLPFSFFSYFFLLKKRKIFEAKLFLVLASLFFYAWWNPVYLPLIFLSMAINYSIGNHFRKEDAAYSKTLLILGIIFNLGLLGFFKYSDFFIANFNLLFDDSLPLLHLALPLAISFFTFQQLAYLVDSYRGETKEYDLLNYALFVTFFPQLIAGPIVHHKEMMPQFFSRWNLVMRYKNIALGLFIFTIGLFKKVVIADYFAVTATQGFDVATTLDFFEAWATSLSYTFQLYFDFSGYTDMAIGAALLFNIRLPINFNSPYKARNIQDFWRRWHMTLSRFLKEYIYIPLGGNRLGDFRTYNNLMITFLIGGLWHGAGWTFVFWGFLHGVALVVNHIWNKLNRALPLFIAWFLTFNFVNIAWVFFRAKEWSDATKVLSAMFDFTHISISFKLQEQFAFLESWGIVFSPWLTHINGDRNTLSFIALALFITLVMKNSNHYLQHFTPGKKLLTLQLMMITAIMLLSGKASEFLYFNF